MTRRVNYLNNKDILKDVPIVKQDSDDDSIEIKKEIVREEKKLVKKPKMVIAHGRSFLF